MYLHPSRTWLWSMVAVVGLMLTACSTDERPDAKQMTAVEYFKQSQANTITPNGQVLASTAEEVGPNVIQYQTSDGSTYQVHYSNQGKDFRYYDARRIDPVAEIVSAPSGE